MDIDNVMTLKDFTVSEQQLKYPTHVKLDTLFHVIDTCGVLLNKKEPDDDDETPSREFNRYAKVFNYEWTDLDGKVQTETYNYVEAVDLPKILFAVFSKQPDEKRILVACMMEIYSD